MTVTPVAVRGGAYRRRVGKGPSYVERGPQPWCRSIAAQDPSRCSGGVFGVQPAEEPAPDEGAQEAKAALDPRCRKWLHQRAWRRMSLGRKYLQAEG